MAKRGKALEQLIMAIQDTIKDCPNTTIQTNVLLKNSLGIDREVDILVTEQHTDRTINIAYECKDYTSSNKKVDIQVLDAMFGKYSLMPNIDRKVLVSRTGFTANVHKLAPILGIELHSLNKIAVKEILNNGNHPCRITPLFELKAITLVTSIETQDTHININIKGDINDEVLREVASHCFCSLSEERRVELMMKYIRNDRKPFEETINFRKKTNDITVKIAHIGECGIEYIAITSAVWFDEDEYKLVSMETSSIDGDEVNIKHHQCSTGNMVEEIATNNTFMLYIKDGDDSLRRFNVSHIE